MALALCSFHLTALRMARSQKYILRLCFNSLRRLRLKLPRRKTTYGDEFKAETNLADVLCLVDDNDMVCVEKGAQACGGDALKEHLRVGIVAIEPQHVAAP